MLVSHHEFTGFAKGVLPDEPAAQYFVVLERMLLTAVLSLAGAGKEAADVEEAAALLVLPRKKLMHRFEAARMAGVLSDTGWNAWKVVRELPFFEAAGWACIGQTGRYPSITPTEVGGMN